MAAPIGFRDNGEYQRFELAENGLIAFAEYRHGENRLIIPHVESAPALRGKGTAGRLMTAIADYARGQQLRIEPVCGLCPRLVPASPGAGGYPRLTASHRDACICADPAPPGEGRAACAGCPPLASAAPPFGSTRIIAIMPRSSWSRM
jgi:predicted GNAT family acetyltransferase